MPLLLGLAVPGLGHLVQGRRGKGILFLVTLLGAYGIGWAVTGGDAVSLRRHPLTLAAQAGAVGPTSVALLASRSRDEKRWIAALVERGALRAEEAGRIPSLGGRGILWKHLQVERGVPESELRAAFWASAGRASRRLDIGTLYVMVAGLLNYLVAADAAEGGRRPPAGSG